MSTLHAPVRSRPGRFAHRRRLRAGLAGAALACLAAQAGLAGADDTEIFFGQVDEDTNVRPNVLFVLDTSGSMNAKDGYRETRIRRLRDAMRTILSDAEDINVGLMRFNGRYGGGPVLYPVTPIEQPVCAGVGCEPVQTNARVGAGADDVEEYLDGYRDGNGDRLVDGRVLSFGGFETEERRVAQAIGLRFDELMVPQGARVLEARLELTARGDSAPGAVTWTVETESDVDARDYASVRADARPYRAPGLRVSVPAWSANERASVDVTAAVRAAVDDPDWCGGNALGIKVTGNGTRDAHSWDAVVRRDDLDDDDLPTLVVRYDLQGIGSGEGCVPRSVAARVAHDDDDGRQPLHRDKQEANLGGGLDLNRDNHGEPTRVSTRFTGLDLPRGADVIEARVDFTVRRRVNGDASVVIHGEDDGDPKRYREKKDELDKRDRTDAHVQWTDMSNPAPGERLRSPDVGPIVEEIAARRDWEPGNALALTFRHVGGAVRREMIGYGNDPDAAPRLVVRYRDRTGVGGGETRTVTAREKMLEIVDSLEAYGDTPTVDTLYEAAQYYLGGPVFFGAARANPKGETYYKDDGTTPDPGYDPQARRGRLSHPDSWTGGAVVDPGGDCGTDLNAEACADEYIAGSPTYLSPLDDSCQTSHIVFVSDGEPGLNVSQEEIEALTGAPSCERFEYRGRNPEHDDRKHAWTKAEIEKGQLCAVELVDWLATTDHNPELAGTQSVRTHTIGFNFDGSDSLRRLGNFGLGINLEADDAAQMVRAFDGILSDVDATETSFTAPAATVNQFNRLTHREDIYFAMFAPDKYPRWPGNLKKFVVNDGTGDDGDEAGNGDGRGAEVRIRDADGRPAVDPDTGFFADAARSFWPERDEAGRVIGGADGASVRRGGAAGQLRLDGIDDGIGQRRVYTWPDPATALPAGGADLTDPANALVETNTAITAEDLGIVGVRAAGAETEAYRRSLLRWARGVDVDDEDADGDAADLRRHMGDPMHSRPAIVNHARPGGDQLSLIHVATNEGFLHAIDADTGRERWAFMPGELLPNIRTLRANDPGVTHPYGFDGPVSTWRVESDDDFVIESGESAYLYVGMRRGGEGYYALDVSDPDAPRLAWAIRGGPGGTPGFAELGQSWSRMSPVKMMIDGAVRDVLVFGGGYDPGQDRDEDALARTHEPDDAGRAIYVVDAATGERLWSGEGSGLASASARFPDMTHAFPGNVRSIDLDRDGLVDQMYAADTGGRIWRFDVSPYHDEGELVRGGIIAELAGPLPADQRRFYVEPDVSLVENGPERFLAVSIGSGWRAHPLDEITQDRFYVVRQPLDPVAAGRYGMPGTGGAYRPVREADLVAVGGADGAGTFEADTPGSGARGWYLDLERPGEKVLGTSITFDDSVIFSTYVPATDVAACSTAIGGGRAYTLDVASGAPLRDLDGDGDVDAADSSVALERGGIPPEAMVLITEDGGDAPMVLFGGERLETGIENRTRRTFWTDMGAGTGSDEPVTTAEEDR